MAKKKRSVKLLTLTLILLALCGGTYLAMEFAPESAEEVVTEEETSIESEIVLGLASTSFNRIDVHNSKGDLSFVREGDGWAYAEDADFPLDSSQMSDIVICFTHLEAYNKIENVTDFAEYGLDDPLVTLTASGGETTTIIQVGNPAPMDSLRYVSIGDGTVYLVDNSIFTNCDLSLDELLKMEELPQVSSFVSISVDDTTIDYVAPADPDSEEATDVWFIDGQAVDASLVESLYNSISSLSWLDCVSYNADDTALAEYGLDEPGLTAIVSYEEGSEQLSYSIEVGPNAEDGTGCYVRLGGSKMVYTISSDAVTAIRENLSYIKENL